MLAGIVHVVLEVPLLAIPLILPTGKLNMVLEVLCARMIKPQVEANKLIGQELEEGNLLGVGGLEGPALSGVAPA